MRHENEVSGQDIDILYEQLLKDTNASGYRLNSDIEFTKELISGLITNRERYGYSSCPCRLAAGNKADDLDIICPCDYRDQDLDEYGACYCALYVSRAAASGEREVTPIPERRLPAEEREKGTADNPEGVSPSLPYPVWRCKVCGYLCARENPPETCPVCKAKQERFERFM